MPYQNVRGGLAIGAGAALSGSPTASELQKDSTGKKEVWLCYVLRLYCFAPFQMLLAAAVRRVSIGNILHLAVDYRVYPNSSMVVTASGFRSKACRFS